MNKNLAMIFNGPPDEESLVETLFEISIDSNFEATSPFSNIQ